jgi:hemolysin III
LPLGKMQNPFRGFLNGAAALVSVAGIVLLVRRAEPGPGRLAAIVFGTGLVALFSASGLYHSVPWNSRWKGIMRRADHSMIFVLIAATYTPVTIASLTGGWRVAGLAGVWGIAAYGMIHRAVTPLDRNVMVTALMLTLGWIGAPIMFPLVGKVGIDSFAWLAAGGVLYTLGMIFMATGRPRLWPTVFSAHELFHVLVVTAATMHFVVVYKDLLPIIV